LAATEHYDYDALGRLVRYINAQGQVTEYVYDAAGNILQVKAGGALTPPVISSTTPGFIRRNQINPVHLTGTGLAGTIVHSVDPTLLVSGVIASSTAIDFEVEVPAAAALGPRNFEVMNSGGVAVTSLQVVPELTFAVVPAPIALPPDGINHKYTLVVSEASPFAQVFSTVAANPAVLRVVSPSVTLPAGALQADVAVAGLATGSTQLLVGAAGAPNSIGFTAIVGTDAAASNIGRSAIVGLAKGDPTAAPGGTQLKASATAVGVVKGDPTTAPGGTQLQAAATAVGLAKGDPTAVPGGTHLQTYATAIGLAKGDPTTAPGGTQLRAYAPVVGLAKGDPTSPPGGQQLGPVVARPVGINRM
jgi:YD repeat-containing protein